MSKIITKCINKHRDKSGSILYYTLTDKQGQKKNFTGQQIKDYIRSGQVEVVNLQIDKLGRLVDKAEQQAPTPQKPTPQKAIYQRQAPQKPVEEKPTEARLVKALIDIIAGTFKEIPEQEAKRHLDIARNLISKYNDKYRYSDNKVYLGLKNNRTELYLNNELIEKSNGQRISIYTLKIACGLLDYNLMVSMGPDGDCTAGMTLIHLDDSKPLNMCTAYDRAIAKKVVEIYKAYHGIEKEPEYFGTGFIDVFRDRNNEDRIRVGNSTIKLSKASIRNTDNDVAVIWWLKQALESIGYDLWYAFVGTYDNNLSDYHVCITERNSLVGRIKALKWYSGEIVGCRMKYMRENGLEVDMPDDKLEELTIKSDILMDGGLKAFNYRNKPVLTILENKNIDFKKIVIEHKVYV